MTTPTLQQPITSSRPALPPGRRSRLLSTLRYMRSAYDASLRNRELFGDPLTVPSLSGPVFTTGRPEAIRDFFSADPDTFRAPPPLAFEPALGRRSLILIDGSLHRKERKLLMPPFHGARMRAYGQSMQAIGLAPFDRLKPGEVFNAQALTQEISLEVIIQTVFGVQDQAVIPRFAQAIKQATEAFGPLVMFFPSLRREFAGMGPWAKFRRNRDALDALIYGEIRGRREDPTPREDILSLLLSARDEEGQPLPDNALRDELVTFLMAGHETTAIAMAWALYWLHRDPAVRNRLLEELKPLGDTPEPEKLVQLPYLEAVCNETLRIYPVVPNLMRTLAKPMSLLGYDLPAGMMVGVSITLLHNDPELYPEPGKFRPERFLERKFAPFEFAPFGGGHRRCLGAAFALYEMKTVLGSVLSRHRLELADANPIQPVRRGITIGPRGGVPMRYLGRA